MRNLSNSYLRPVAISAAFLATSLSGCKAKEMAGNFSDNAATSVDHTWIAAARTCWPSMDDDMFTDGEMKRFLIDPNHFRAAFSTYSELTDADLLAIIPKPIQQAPPPDSAVLTNSNTALLTRAQAVDGLSIQQAINDNRGVKPDDALCSIHPGVPVGFK